MEQEERSLDIKKIALGVVILSILGWIAYQNKDILLAYNTPVKEVAGESIVKQEQSSKTTIVSPQIDIQEKVNEIAQQVSTLDVKEVTASSPQIQKVLKDMESLKNLPKNEAKEACMNICKSL